MQRQRLLSLPFQIVHYAFEELDQVVNLKGNDLNKIHHKDKIDTNSSYSFHYYTENLSADILSLVIDN